jgi:hypothetical protein
VFANFRQRVEGLRDAILNDGSKIVRREWALSVRERFYLTGKGQKSGLSAEAQSIVEDGNKKTWRMQPTEIHMTFGEYGTGQRGRATGEPAPAGYAYGNRAGMAARRFSRIAITTAAPQVRDMAILKARQFARNVTAS